MEKGQDTEQVQSLALPASHIVPLAAFFLLLCFYLKFLETPCEVFIFLIDGIL